jgi:subtilase family serine protease
VEGTTGSRAGAAAGRSRNRAGRGRRTTLATAGSLALVLVTAGQLQGVAAAATKAKPVPPAHPGPTTTATLPTAPGVQPTTLTQPTTLRTRPAPKPHGPGAIEVDPGHSGDAHHPLSLRVLGYDVNGAPMVTSSTPSGYTPATIKKYLGLTGTGSSQTIAIVDAYNDPTISTDLAAFDKQFGLSAPASFKRVSQTGSTTSLPATDAGWSLEISLDVEWAHAVAPSAGILLVEASSSSLTNLDTAIDYAAKQSGVVVISNSWGTSGDVSGETSLDSHCKLTKAVCVFSTGDAGYPGGYPAYSPYVVAVGGTTLNLSTGSTGLVSVASEAAWSGSGGGVSIYEAKPAYQAKLTATGRSIPDVSYDADPSTGFAVYDSTAYNAMTGWFQMGGTSAGAHQWSAIIAAADQLRKSKSKAPLAAWNSTNSTYQTGLDLYGLTSGLADVTTGAANGACGSICSPTVGYDTVTGLGSPRPGIDSALTSAT